MVGQILKLGVKKVASLCALLTQAYFRTVWNMHTKDLDSPYENQVSQAFSDAIQAAKEYKAWVTDYASLCEFPDIGDAIQIGQHPIYGYEAHFLNVIGTDENGLVVSVDSGQGPGNQVLKRKRMLVVPQEGKYAKAAWLVDPDKPYLADGKPNGRPIVGKCSAKKLKEYFQITD